VLKPGAVRCVSARQTQWLHARAITPDSSFPCVGRTPGIPQASPSGVPPDDGQVGSGVWTGTKRVLVKEVNWLGDLVLSLPALRMLRSAFGGATLSILIRQELAGFFDGMDWIDEVIPYTVRAGPRGWADQRKMIAAVRARRFDLAVIFPNSFRSALWTLLAGVPRRAGYATDGRRLLLTNYTVPMASTQNSHQRFYWIEMVRKTLGISSAPADNMSYQLEVSQQSVARMKQWLASNRRNPGAALIAISSGAAYGPAKEWPPVHYARLIDLLRELSGAECVLLGTASERFKCQKVASMSRAGALIAAGETDVADLKALLSLCDGFAGNDSGAMHLAAALGIPAVGIFGSTNPARTGPVGPKASVIYHQVHCSPCLKRTCRFGHYQCLQSIAPEEITAALTQHGAFVIAR
jgi:heptosyltransferase II